jgi:hypothetical protein
MRVPLEQAASICGVKPGTIRRWVHDSRIVRYPDDGFGEYEVDELLLWIDARNPDALMVRAGLSGDHGTRLRRGA